MAGRKLLVLDLDETLIHATERLLAWPGMFQVGPYHVYERPHLAAFVASCLEAFEVAVWTASSPDYADAIVARIFPEPSALAFVWARDRCTLRSDPDTRELYRVKDLKKVRQRGYSLANVIVVDDTARKHERNYGNLVCVSPFEGDPRDEELPRLADYLATLAAVEDVRVVEKRGWNR